MSDHNPYAPPVAVVADLPETAPSTEDCFHTYGRHRSAGHGWAWYKEAWKLFKPQPFKWWLVLIVFIAILIAASLLPFLNLLTSLLFPILAAGIGTCANTVRLTGRFDLSDVFDGFKKRPLVQVLVGVLYLAIMLSLLGLISLLFDAKDLLHVFTGGWAAQEASQRMFQEQGGLFFLAYFGATMVGMASLSFAPYLVQEQGMSAPQAMLASASGCFKNIPACFIATICYLLLAIVATIPLALGWLALIPVLVLTVYAAYRDIYLASD